jgi:hypothetical protein
MKVAEPRMSFAVIFAAGWFVGMTFSLLLVTLDGESVHTAWQVPVFLLSLPQVILAGFTGYLLRGPDHIGSASEVSLVMWGGALYGTLAVLVVLLKRFMANRRSDSV